MKFRYVINPRAIALLGLMAILAVILAISVSPLHAQSPPVNNADQPALDVEVLVDGLSRPWDLTFTPDETMLFTQRSGVLSARLTDGTVQTITADFSDFRASGEGGFMAILVDPNFSSEPPLLHVPDALQPQGSAGHRVDHQHRLYRGNPRLRPSCRRHTGRRQAQRLPAAIRPERLPVDRDRGRR